MSRFTDSLGLRLLEDAAGRPITYGGRCQWELLADLAYDVGEEGSGVTIWARRGSRTDLASIPRLAWSLLPPDGPWLKAAVIHDALYRTQGELERLGHPQPFTRKEADKILREAMGVLGVAGWKRAVIYRAVRLGGRGGWGA